MSSINKYPTFHYSQPGGYHFSHDSVFLAREVFERHHTELSQTNVKILDLCAGCGIVGMDLVFHLLNEKSFSGAVDFLEVQELYHPHFEKNRVVMQGYFPGKTLHFNWINASYATVDTAKKYDFIVSNPPYFLSGSGVLSPNEFKNRCRFFIDSDWQMMLHFIGNSLSENGQAYFLVRSELKAIIEKEWPEGSVTFPFQVRSTWVAHLKK